MSLTLPTEIQTEKQKVAHKPILMIDFSDVGVYVASKSYTLSLTGGGNRNYDDLIKQGSFAEITHDINEMFGTLAGTPQVTVTLLDYRGTLRASLLGTSPDLTGSAVSVYLKFDTSSTDEADRVMLFSGIVADYNEKRDVLSLTFKTTWLDRLVNLPQRTIISYDSEADVEDDITFPLQYGDFSWSATDPRFITEFANSIGTMAICPIYKKVAALYYIAVADHSMTNLPSVTQLESSAGDTYLFIRRDNRWVHLTASSVTINSSSTPVTITAQLGTGYVWMSPTAAYTAGDDTNPADVADVFDGDSTTYATAWTTPSADEQIEVHNVNIDEFEELTIVGGFDAYFYVKAMTGSGIRGWLRIRQKSDNSVLSEVELNDSTTLGWIRVIGDSDGNNVNNYYFEVEANTNINIDISEIVIRIRVQGLDLAEDDPCVYLRCQGRPFSGTWGGRRTSGALITHPVDMVESIIRDELSETPDTDTFDAVKGLTSYTIAATVYKQTTAKELFSDICEQFGYGLTFSPTGNIAIMKPDSGLTFTDSGTSTPGNEDILTDSETVTNNSFNQHPILLGGFSLQRTSVSDIVKKVTLKYGQLWGGNFLKQVSSGSGTPELVLENRYIIDSTVASNIAAVFIAWRSTQKFIAEMVTFFNALGFELGDVKNIRHGDLNDNIVANTVNTQKWMLFSYALNFVNGLIKLKFVELRD